MALPLKTTKKDQVMKQSPPMAFLSPEEVNHALYRAQSTTGHVQVPPPLPQRELSAGRARLKPLTTIIASMLHSRQQVLAQGRSHSSTTFSVQMDRGRWQVLVSKGQKPCTVRILSSLLDVMSLVANRSLRRSC